MASPTLYMLPLTVLVQYLTNLGVIAAGASIVTQVAGSVSTLQTTYTDSTGLVANANPLTLNSAGRAAGSSGALVAFWVLPGVVVDVYFTDTLGETWAIKNMAAINDPATLEVLLANPATGFGADLVANVVRSYDVYASLRAANVPSLVSGQTLVVDVEGGLLVNDGNGGLFYWSSTSTAADNGSSVIKPNAILPANPGRYLRQVNLFGTSSSFTMTVTGCTTSPVLTCQAVTNGNLVTVQVPPSGTLVSNSTAFGLNFWPAILRDNALGFTSGLFGAQDNSTLGVAAYCSINSAIGGNSASIIPNNASGLWTASGNKSFNGFTFTYFLPNGHP